MLSVSCREINLHPLNQPNTLKIILNTNKLHHDNKALCQSGMNSADIMDGRFPLPRTQPQTLLHTLQLSQMEWEGILSWRSSGRCEFISYLFKLSVRSAQEHRMRSKMFWRRRTIALEYFQSLKCIRITEFSIAGCSYSLWPCLVFVWIWSDSDLGPASVNLSNSLVFCEDPAVCGWDHWVVLQITFRWGVFHCSYWIIITDERFE